MPPIAGPGTSMIRIKIPHAYRNAARGTLGDLRSLAVRMSKTFDFASTELTLQPNYYAADRGARNVNDPDQDSARLSERCSWNLRGFAIAGGQDVEDIRFCVD